MEKQWFIGSLVVQRYLGDQHLVVQDLAEAAAGSDVKVVLTLDEAMALGHLAEDLARGKP